MRRRNHINKYAADKLYDGKSIPEDKPMSPEAKKRVANFLCMAMHASILSGNISLAKSMAKFVFDDGPREEISDDEKA